MHRTLKRYSPRGPTIFHSLQRLQSWHGMARNAVKIMRSVDGLRAICIIRAFGVIHFPPDCPQIAISAIRRVFRDQEVAGSNPVTPTILQIRPFGENVERLSLCGD
jgi:hypothetical protein